MVANGRVTAHPEQWIAGSAPLRLKPDPRGQAVHRVGIANVTDQRSIRAPTSRQEGTLRRYTPCPTKKEMRNRTAVLLLSLGSGCSVVSCVGSNEDTAADSSSESEDNTGSTEQELLAAGD